MRRLHKKGALELSINAIVIVILAMTLLGLGLGFVRNMFTDISKTTTGVQDQVREQILEDLRTGDKKLSFPSQTVKIEGGNEDVIAIGVKNTEARDLNFQIELLVREDTDDGPEFVPVKSDTELDTRDDKYAFFWDDLQQTLGPGEAVVVPINLKADRTAAGTKLFKILVSEIEYDEYGDKIDPLPEYVSKTFFVKFI